MSSPLRGVRVIELGSMITAPLAGMILAEFGAEVIKVERPDGGDPFRGFKSGLNSPQFVAYNKGKRSVTLDLQKKPDADRLRELIAGADVLLENFRPGVLERLGFAPNDLRKEFPKLIFCSITGFGATGPYRQRPAYDTVGQALSGILSLFLNAERPRISGPTIADNVTGMYAALGILAALAERRETGTGRRVEVNMLEASVAFSPDVFAALARTGTVSGPFTRVAASQSFTFKCADGQLLAIHISSPQKFWIGLLTAIGRLDLADDPRFAARDGRFDNYGTLHDILDGEFAKKARAHWVQVLEAQDVPFAPVHRIDEVLTDPQILHLGTVQRGKASDGSDLLTIRRPIRIDNEQDDIVLPAPQLGEHNSWLESERAVRLDP